MITNLKPSKFPEKMNRKTAVLTTFEKHEQQDMLDCPISVI